MYMFVFQFRLIFSLEKVMMWLRRRQNEGQALSNSETDILKTREMLKFDILKY